MERKKNYVFIDAQNLYLGTQLSGWKIDYKKFRQYICDKYNVEKIFYFIGYKQENEDLYTMLKNFKYDLVFKEMVYGKGNCDADLIIKCIEELNNFEKAIIISGDGDFLPLYKYLIKRNKLFKIGIPHIKGKSRLLNPFHEYFLIMSQIQEKIEKDS